MEPDLDGDGARISIGDADDASLLREIQRGGQEAVALEAVAHEAVAHEAVAHEAVAHEAVAVLYDRYGGMAYGLAFRITGDASAAEDAVQDAFVSLWRQAPRFDAERGQVRSWLMTIVHHKAVDIVRKRSNRPERPLPDGPDEFVATYGQPEAAAEQVLDAAAVREAVRQIPEEQRKTIEMAYFMGMTHVAISEQTGVPLGTVKSRLRIGLEKMREYLRPKVLE